MNPLPFLLLFSFPAIAGYAAWRGDHAWISLWVLALVILPILDLVVPTDPFNPPVDSQPREPRRSLFTYFILGYVPVQLALTAYVLWVGSTAPLSWLDRIGIVATLGLSNGAIGFTLAHELVHRTERLEKAFGRALLLSLAYPHWAIEHVRGHHRYVGTPRDPATARLGEMFFLFLPRTVFGQMGSAWLLETERLRKIGRSPWSADNEVIGMLAIEILLLIGLYAWLGPLGLLLYAVQVLVAVTLLEATNYSQHYGLQRAEIAPGRYGPQAPRHSWNTYHRLTNWYTIELGRHSDHHAQPGRPYQLLRRAEDVPQLPAGYGAMITLAMIPPLWFWVMNPRAKAWRQEAKAALPETGSAA